MNGASQTLRLAIVGAVVALIAVAGVLATALSLGHGIDSRSTPIVTTVLGLIGTTVTALLALLAVVGVDKKVNGHIARLTEIATQAAAQTGDQDLAAKADEAIAIATDAGAQTTSPLPPPSEEAPK